MLSKPQVQFLVVQPALLFTLGWVLLVVPRGLKSAAQDDPNLVRARIDAIWGGFESFQCRSVERFEDPLTKVDTVRSVAFSWKIDGRMAWSSTTQQPDATKHFDVREDGAKRTTANYFPTPSKVIDQVKIGSARGEPGRVGEMVFASLWTFLPDGRTVADLLDNGGSLANNGTTSQPRWTLTAASERCKVECLLDELHQFLPSELTVRTNTSQRTIRVDRFERANDFWYPAAGTCETTAATLKSGPHLARWQLDQVVINQPIPDAKFVWTDLPSGVQVFNLIDNTSRIVGGKLARLKLMRTYPAIKEKAPSQDPIEVPSDPGADVRSLLTLGLLTLTILAGGTGVFLRRRGL